MKTLFEEMDMTIVNAAEAQTPRGAVPLEIMRQRDFRLLWISQGIGRLGDQFYLVALPWLVLQLTGDAFAMSTVLAVASIPRALFMLIGGALTDRFSSRTLMLASSLLRLVLVALLSGLVLAGSIELWMLYPFALIFGLMDGFFYPALNAIVPQLVDQERLQTGNALIQGTGQLAMFAGPIVAGSLIAFLDGGLGPAAVQDTVGNGIAFAFNAFTFLVSAIMLWMMKGHQPKQVAAAADKHESVWSSIRDGLAYVSEDVTLRTFFLITAAITFLMNGPFGIGVPVLAETRFEEGAAAFGMILSAFGGGSFLGTVMAGILPKPAPLRFATILLVLTSMMGIGLALLGFVSSAFAAAAVAFAMGVANGYVVILFITWLQSRTPAALLGRMMSLLMFALVGLNPISSALAGAVAKLHATMLFAGAGSLLVMIALISLFSPTVRAMGAEREELAPRPADYYASIEVGGER